MKREVLRGAVVGPRGGLRCEADLVVLSPDLRVLRTLVAGRTVYAA